MKRPAVADCPPVHWPRRLAPFPRGRRAGPNRARFCANGGHSRRRGPGTLAARNVGILIEATTTRIDLAALLEARAASKRGITGYDGFI